MTEVIFITATGTDIGKTYAACELIKHYQTDGKNVRALKPLISGFDTNTPEESDTAHLLAALGKPLTSENIDQLSPWRFKAALSPDMAARAENTTIGFDELISFCHQEITRAKTDNIDILLIEGVGGLMVPITDHHTVLDWIKALDCHIYMVAGTYLGTISHILTAITSLDTIARKTEKLILSESIDSSVPLDETCKTLSHFLPDLPIQILPRT